MSFDRSNSTRNSTHGDSGQRGYEVMNGLRIKDGGSNFSTGVTLGL